MMLQALNLFARQLARPARASHAGITQNPGCVASHPGLLVTIASFAASSQPGLFHHGGVVPATLGKPQPARPSFSMMGIDRHGGIGAT